jgi:hypothetical protein
MPTQTIDDARNANAPVVSKADAGFATLSSFIMQMVKEWRDSRNSNQKDAWDKFERVYRGMYSRTDAARETERSRLIAPALQQAVDSTAAAIEDAIFGRAQWFDVSDDVADEQKEDIEAARKVQRGREDQTDQAGSGRGAQRSPPRDPDRRGSLGVLGRHEYD